jgi:AcrR family transcriptional regulator
MASYHEFGMAGKRAYRSELRDRRAYETREAIVDAAVRLLTRQRVPPISVPELAAEAGVGVATVYRHFPAKDDVLDAVYDRWMGRARDLLVGEPQHDLETFLAVLPELWRRQSEDERLAEAMSSYSTAGRRVRRRRRDRRRAVAQQLLSGSRIPSDEKARLAPIVLLLTSTTAHKHLREYWDVDTDQAADLVASAIRTLVRSAEHRTHAAAGSSPPTVSG